MKRLDEIRARVTHAAQRENQVSNGQMRIPGMKIGTQMSPTGPKYEDIMWMADKLEIVSKFMKDATYQNQTDMHVAIKLIHDIEGGR